MAAVMVALIVASGFIFSKSFAKADSTKKDNQLISYKISLPSNYYYGKKTSEMILHYGVNGWNDTKDVKMYVTTGDYHYGIPASYNYNAVIKVRKGDTINYCFKAISNVGTTSWNNNGGKDYSVVADESNVKNVEYEIDWLATSDEISSENSEVTLRYGINGWDNPNDIKMEVKTIDYNNGKKYTWYKAVISVEEGSTINYAVKASTSSGIIWDNNNNNNYTAIAK